MESEIMSILLFSAAAIAIPVLSVKFAVKWPLLTLIGSFMGSILYAVIGAGIFWASEQDYMFRYPLMIVSLLWLPLILAVQSFAPLALPYNQMPWWKTLARTILFILFEILLLAGLLVIFNFVGFIFFVFLIVATFRYHAAARCNRALEIISTLSAAMRQNLPLPTALQTAAIGRTDKTARIFCHIAYWLTQGHSLAESIRKGYPRCMPQIVLAVESAEKLNQLPQTLLSLEKDLANDSDESRKIRPVHPWYPAIVLFFIIVLTLGLLFFIIPTFSAVLDEMSNGRESLPGPTQFLINLSLVVLSWKGLFVITGTILTVYLGWSYYIFRTRISYKPGVFLNFVDWLRWFGPIQSKLERNLSTLHLVEILRPALSAGLPLPQAITAAMGAKMNICFKNRVNRWLQCVEGGADVAQSARACGIGYSVAWALDDKTNPGQAAVLLEMLEENCRNKHNYLGNIIRSILWPLVIVALGAFVGFIVYAMFIPMIQIITIGIQNVNP